MFLAAGVFEWNLPFLELRWELEGGSRLGSNTTDTPFLRIFEAVLE